MDTLKIGTIKWHHILNPADDDLDKLTEEFHFHPLDIEDCKTAYNQRPKIDVYDDYYFLILHFPHFDRSNRFLKTKEIKIFWGEDYIITMGKPHWAVTLLFNETRIHLENKEEIGVGTSDALLYIILERMMKETYIILRRIGEDVEVSSRELFDKKAEKIIERISMTRKNIILLNTIFKPQLPLFARLESKTIEGFAESMEEYWGNILDYCQKMWDMTEDYAELIEGLSHTFDSLQANKTNEIMKILTMISSILLPLTFLTGLYGMNLNLPFQDDTRSFWILVGFMLIIVAFMYIYFKRRKWL